MSEHIHEDSFFCGGAVGQKVNDFIIECFVRASQVISKEIVGGYIKGVSECNKYINTYLTLPMFNVIEMSP